jgi:hypothetical protein
VDELVRRKVNVLVTPGGAVVIRAAQQPTRTIPIVMVGAGDPVAKGFVVSLARPGGNITGLSLLSEGLPGKRLEILKEAVPQSMRVAVLANPASPTYASVMHNLTVAAEALGLHLHVVALHRPDELDTAFAAMTRAGADALLVVADSLLINPLRKYKNNECFSGVRSKRKSLLHKAPADFSTASGENSRVDGANSRQNQGISAVPHGAPVSPCRQMHGPARAALYRCPRG